MAKLLVLHGPNLNLLGEREPGIYGRTSLAAIDRALRVDAESHGHTLDAMQSNAEHELIDRLHAGLIINPGGFTHTSVALRDAVAALDLPFIEVHLSNPHAREPFRKQSYFSDLAMGVISGFGADSYRFAMEAALTWLDKRAASQANRS